MTDRELLEKAIYWFKIIAEDMERITTGNLPHCAATTKGRAIRAYEFLEKHKEEPVSEELEEAASSYAKEEYNHKNPATLPDRCRGCYAPLMYAFKAGARWQKEQMIALLDAAKKETNIGLNEWENGVEHGRMEVITSLTEKIEAL